MDADPPPTADQPRPLWSAERLRVLAAALPARGKFEWLPLLRRLRGYGVGEFRADAQVGINVALLDFQQGMDYALNAGLPFQHGIYASAIAAGVMLLVNRRGDGGAGEQEDAGGGKPQGGAR